MQQKHKSLNTTLVLLLICVFAAAVLLTLAFGARVYRRINDDTEESFSRRTALSYITAKVHHADMENAVGVTSFGGGDALCLSEEYGGVVYDTLIYVYNGRLCELYSERGLSLEPDAGADVLNADSLLIELSGGLLELNCTTDGVSETARIYLRSGSGGAA